MFDTHKILLSFTCWCPTRAKDHGLFYLNYPQMNNVGKSRFLEFQAYWYTYLVISPYRILHPPSKLNR